MKKLMFGLINDEIIAVKGWITSHYKYFLVWSKFLKAFLVLSKCLLGFRNTDRIARGCKKLREKYQRKLTLDFGKHFATLADVQCWYFAAVLVSAKIDHYKSSF